MLGTVLWPLTGTRYNKNLRELSSVFRDIVSENVTNSKIIVQGKLKTNLVNLTQAIVEPTESQFPKRVILVAKSLENVNTGELPLRFAIMSNESQKIYSGTLAPKCEQVEAVLSQIIDGSQNGDINKCVGACQQSPTSDFMFPFQQHETDYTAGPHPKYGRLAPVSNEDLKISMGRPVPYYLRPNPRH